MKKFLTLFICTLALHASAQNATLVKDLNGLPAQTISSFITTSNGSVFYAGFEPSTGEELYAFSNTEQKFILLKDLVPGEGGSEIRDFTEVGNLIYFSAKNASGNRALWQTDGTSAGTIEVEGSTDPVNLISFKESLLFSTSLTTDLWILTAGMANKIKASSGNSTYVPNNYALLDSIVILTLSDEAGVEIWRTNGTNEGTYRLADIYSGANGSTPRELTAFKNKVFFWASDGSNLNFYETDGSVAGTKFVRSEGLSYNDIGKSVVLNDSIYFQHSSSYYTLRRTDGSAAPSDSCTTIGSVPDALFTLAGGIYYNTPSIIRYDPATGQNSVIQIIENNSDCYIYGPTVIMPEMHYQKLSDKVLFGAEGDGNGHELWVTDGTEAGTYLVKDINAGEGSSFIHGFTSYQGNAYFLANSGNGSQIWMSDGNAVNTVQLTDQFISTSSSWISHTTTVGNNIMFMEGGISEGSNIYATDGTVAGTVLLASQVLTGYSNTKLTTLNNKAYFFGKNDSLYISDGTIAGTSRIYAGGVTTQPIICFSACGCSAVPKDISNTTSAVYYFTFQDTQHQLRKYDPITGSISLIKEFASGIDVSFSVSFQGIQYFVTSSGELWRTDGTATGTYSVFQGTDVLSNLAVNSQGEVIFESSNSIYIYDGVSPNPTVLAEAFGHIHYATNVNENLFFTVSDKLYVTDGLVIVELASGLGMYISGSATDYYNTLYLLENEFPVTNIIRTDGTVNGTWTLSGNFSNPSALISAGKSIIFSAVDPIMGHELFATDGTEPGTFLLENLYPGFPSSTPNQLAVNGNELYFAGDHPNYGRELFRLDVANLITGIDPIKPGKEAKVSIFPNPASHSFRIKSEEKVTKIEILNIAGELVECPDSLENIHINRLKAGIYIVKLYTEKGNYSQKLVKY